MMTQAFYTGLTGLHAGQKAIDVITDNLANTSTVGFRGYTTEFSNMFERALNTDAESSSVSSTVGVGTKLDTILMDESRGVFQLTESANDLAILGDGWFGIQGLGETLYTRDGSFTFDSNRDLVTHDGFFVLGTMGNNIDGEILTEDLGNIPLSDVTEQEKLSFPENLYYPPIPTSEANFYGNLSLNESVQTISTKAINPEGTKNNLRLEFNKSDVQVPPGVQWDVTATIEGLADNTVYSTETGVVSFDETGLLISNTLSSIDNQGAPININLGGTNGFLISIQADPSVSSTSDGLKPGELTGYEINKNGEVLATFTNGEQSNVATVAVFQFANDRGLVRANGARFFESSNSGTPQFTQDADGNNIIGTDLTNFKLEGSNVRLDAGLTEIIIMQRSYDANSKSITTADQMLQKALSMDA
ncbi:flagellar hook-basal body complex protein [Sulfurimonas sp.]|nr:flagellar hook-basal body complex protein [Sulfurimonas sp.]